jgi:hypothetical protein
MWHDTGSKAAATETGTEKLLPAVSQHEFDKLIQKHLLLVTILHAPRMFKDQYHYQ